MQQEATLKLKNRDISYLEADLACVKAIAQATVNVELFTIPLYMVSLYSIQGMHQINSAGSKLYTGRWWPGSGATPATEKNHLQPTKMYLIRYIAFLLKRCCIYS